MFTDATPYLEKKQKQKTITSAITSLCKTGIIYLSFKKMCINKQQKDCNLSHLKNTAIVTQRGLSDATHINERLFSFI